MTTCNSRHTSRMTTRVALCFRFAFPIGCAVKSIIISDQSYFQERPTTPILCVSSPLLSSPLCSTRPRFEMATYRDQLLDVFKKMDTNKDGRLDCIEIINYMTDNGYHPMFARVSFWPSCSSLCSPNIVCKVGPCLTKSNFGYVRFVIDNVMSLIQIFKKLASLCNYFCNPSSHNFFLFFHKSGSQSTNYIYFFHFCCCFYYIAKVPWYPFLLSAQRHQLLLYCIKRVMKQFLEKHLSGCLKDFVILKEICNRLK